MFGLSLQDCSQRWAWECQSEPSLGISEGFLSFPLSSWAEFQVLLSLLHNNSHYGAHRTCFFYSGVVCESLIQLRRPRKITKTVTYSSKRPPENPLLVPGEPDWEPKKHLGNTVAHPFLYHSSLLQNMSRFDPKGEGHRATNYSRWFDATKSYPVTYTFR